MKSYKILIIDDEEKLSHLMARIISLEGFEVLEANTCTLGLKKIDQYKIDVVLCDVKLPDGNGIEMVKQIREKSSRTKVIILTAYGNIYDGVQAIKNGAFDYLVKGDDNNKIIPMLHRAVQNLEIPQTNDSSKSKDKVAFSKVIGKSESIKKAMELAKKVAKTDTTVLLRGETGTGKEVFAHAIHQESLRSNHPFVAINCSAFSKELLENEMFGHKAGSFTNANKDQKGLFEEANHGSIFLDEIGEMSLELQAKLLRVLESGEFFRIGDTKPTKVDLRIISATHRNLLKEIENGNFREDLFYRISTFQIQLPALRERLEDIEDLMYYFLELFSSKMNKKIVSVSNEFLIGLKKHEWKGNIRELKNVMERSVILADETITIEHLPIDFQQNAINISVDSENYKLSNVEKNQIQKVLAFTQGNKTKSAELLGIALTTLYRKMAEYGLE